MAQAPQTVPANTPLATNASTQVLVEVTGLERVQSSWKASWRSIWRPLLQTKGAPPDLFVELLRRLAEEKIPTKRGNTPRKGIFLADAALNRIDLDDALSSSEKAQANFKSIKNNEFKSGESIVRYFETASLILREFDDDIIYNKYIKLLKNFILEYNHPIKLKESPLSLQVRVPFVMERFYQILELQSAGNEHLTDALSNFERSWNEFHVEKSSDKYQTAIDRASKVAEAFVGHRLSKNTALSDMIREMGKSNEFPHRAFEESISKMYGFCGDYPHIRHGSNGGQNRKLEQRDAAFASMMLVAFAAYAHDK